MYSKKYGYSKEETLLVLSSNIGNMKYQALSLICTRLSRAIRIDKAHTYFIITHRHGKFVLAVEFHPLAHGPKFVATQRRLAKQYFKELSKYI